MSTNQTPGSGAEQHHDARPDESGAPEALRASELRYRRLFEAAQDGILILDATTGIVVDVNPFLVNLLGYPREVFLAKKVWELGFLSDTVANEDMFRELQAKDYVRYEDLPLETSDGRRIEVELVSNVYLGNEQRLIQCNIRDITERKRAEEELRVSEERYRIVADFTYDWETWLNPDGNFVYVSTSCERVTGYTAEEFMQDSGLMARIIQTEDHGNLTCMSKSLTAGPSECDFRIVTRTGDVKWISHCCQPVFSKDGRFLGRRESNRDITERKRAEEERINAHGLLEKALNFTEALLSAIPTPVFYKDREGRYLGCNRAFFEVMGVASEEMKGKTVYELWPSEHARTYHDKDLELMRNPALQVYEFKVRDKYGVDRPVIYAKSVFRDENDQVAGIVGAFQDISERVRAEERSEKLKAQLAQAQKMESVGRLAGGVAHDFNNILGIILGYTELALDLIGPDEPLHADLEEIQKAAQRSADLTRQLLAFARKQNIVPKEIDLNNTVGSMLNMLQRLIGEDIVLDWKPGQGLWPVKMDPAQIDQILANLCVNARDAIAGVGRLTVETRNTDFDDEYCAQQAGFTPGEYVMLSISDDGCGMDSETLLLLFEPFFTTKEMGKGTGLGLATVYGIVKQNNGFINVYSEPGQGTTFNIYLPRHVAQTEPLPRKAPVQVTVRGQETILLVEDEPAILRMTTIMLERQGYTVLEASSPGEAIRLATEHTGRIDLLLTDVIMPEMNGRDLATNILSIHPDIKRLFMSGYTANVIAHYGVLDEGEQFIQKPFSVNELGLKLREALEG